jgi:hypothetical protein
VLQEIERRQDKYGEIEMHKKGSAMSALLVFSIAHPQTADEVVNELKTSQKLEDGAGVFGSSSQGDAVIGRTHTESRRRK